VVSIKKRARRSTGALVTGAMVSGAFLLFAAALFAGGGDSPLQGIPPIALLCAIAGAVLVFFGRGRQ